MTINPEVSGVPGEGEMGSLQEGLGCLEGRVMNVPGPQGHWKSQKLALICALTEDQRKEDRIMKMVMRPDCLGIGKMSETCDPSRRGKTC